MQASKIIQEDRQYIWHPYTQMYTARDPIVVVKGEGAHLYDENGTRYLDGISSWWVNLHGHAHPYIAEKIQEQAILLEHTLFAGCTHEGAVTLAKRLISIIPGEMSKIFYSDNGSTAVETALKMAFQYWYNRNPKTKRKKIVSFKNSYHGDTFGAMSASGRNSFNRPFWSHLFESEQIDLPTLETREQSLRQMEEIISKGDCACFIFEPILLTIGGMICYPPEGLDALIQLCRKYSVITIADEVATGFGRTGPLFASELLEEAPDIICLSKGITGGFLPLGATLCKSFIFDAFLSDNPAQALLHGHSYCANPLACAAALASLDLLEDQKCTNEREFIEESHRLFCLEWQRHPKLKRCESLGTILILEYAIEHKSSSYFHSLRNRLDSFFVQSHILLRPLGNILYVCPPYCIQKEELDLIYQTIATTLEEDVL